jgi:hypothetical protein
MSVPVLTRENLIARILELEDENADLSETLQRINELSTDAIKFDTDQETEKETTKENE